MRFSILAVAAASTAASRTRATFDFGWLFHLGDFPNWSPPCNTSSFNINLNGTQCYGLSQVSASGAADCQDAACTAEATVWQWCPPGGSCGGANSECWIGNDCSQNASNSGTTGWVSAMSAGIAPPGPPPPCTDPSQPCNPAYPDNDPTQWRNLNVPHDFVVESPSDPSCDRGHGYKCYNVSWYRKHFDVDAALQGQMIYLTFDGVYRQADVWLNGAYLGHHTEGYTPFNLWIHNASTPLKYGAGGNNVLAIRVDARSPELWSYEPGGVYRHVWMTAVNPVSIVPWGFYVPSAVTGAITSPSGAFGPQSADHAMVMPVVDIANGGTSSASVTLAFSLTDASGNVVASINTASISLPAGGWTRQQLSPATFGSSTSQVNLWNTAAPYLYTASVSLVDASTKAVYDSDSTRIGVRTAVFDPNNGFMLNGIKVPLQGASNHIDFGGCGGAVPDRVNEWRVANYIKDLGGNAWRTAHNPVSPEFLDAADEYGLLVWSENRFINTGVQPLAPKPISGSNRGVESAWKNRKQAVGAQPYGPNSQGGPLADPQLLADAQAMVLSARNHPSIIIWSLCNEGGCEQGAAGGGDIGQQFKNAILAVDTTRPITGNSEWSPGTTDTFTNAMDVQSFSYAYGSYSEFKAWHPWKAVGGGESASCTSTRGYYLPNNSTTGYVNADDFGCVQEAWASVMSLQYVYGNFAWTGYDYKGEPSPMNWPCINSHFGIYDIAGFRKDSTGYYRAWWKGYPKGNCTEVSLSPMDWTQPVPGGQPITITAFTCAASVALYVNGVAQGAAQPVQAWSYVQWQNIPFVPGNITAIAYDGNGNAVGTTTVRTTGPAYKLSMWVESPYNAPKDGSVLMADGQDTTLLGVAVQDVNGLTVPVGSFNISFTTSGPAVVYGVANGDPSDHSLDKESWRLSFHGLARAFIASSAPGATGSISVTASAQGLQPATVTLTAQ